MCHFDTWASLKDAFLAHFRPISYEEKLYERLAELQMVSGERCLHVDRLVVKT